MRYNRVGLYLYDVLQVGADPATTVALRLQVVEEGRHMLVVHAPQVLQDRPAAGRDGAQQTDGAAGVLSDTEFAALDGVHAADEGLDLLGQLLGTRSGRNAGYIVFLIINSLSL